MEELTDSESLEYTVRFSDKSSTTFDSADDVLNIQNSKEKRIASIWVESPYRDEPRIQVKIQNEIIYLDPIEYEVAGNEKDVFHASARLDEYFSGLRQWYSLIVNAGFKTYFIYGFIMLPIGILVSLGLASLLGINFTNDAGNFGNSNASFRDKVLVIFWVLSPGVVVVAGLSLLDRTRRWLFPNGTFAIGDGVERHNSTVLVRRVVGGGVVLALLVSLLASAIFAQFS